MFSLKAKVSKFRSQVVGIKTQSFYVKPKIFHIPQPNSGHMMRCEHLWGEWHTGIMGNRALPGNLPHAWQLALFLAAYPMHGNLPYVWQHAFFLETCPMRSN